VSPARYVLVVEDDPGVREGLVDIIAGEGYAVDSCQDGKIALDRLSSADELPDVIVLDFLMPQMDGWMFLRERAKDPRLCKIPVLGMSASPHLVDQRGSPSGVDEFLRKPFKVEAVLSFIRKHSEPQSH
jgi:two-component system phosphate regulon response regulator PhoB